MRRDTGRAAIVVPDNVLSEVGAGEKIRRALPIPSVDAHLTFAIAFGDGGITGNVKAIPRKIRPLHSATRPFSCGKELEPGLVMSYSNLLRSIPDWVVLLNPDRPFEGLFRVACFERPHSAPDSTSA
jgi:hypothetical protein